MSLAIREGYFKKMLADEDGLEEEEMQGESILERVSHLYKDIKTACQDMAVLIFSGGVQSWKRW